MSLDNPINRSSCIPQSSSATSFFLEQKERGMWEGCVCLASRSLIKGLSHRIKNLGGPAFPLYLLEVVSVACDANS